MLLNENNLEARANLLYECSCYEEYMIRRDIEIALPFFGRMLDPIALCVKYPLFKKMVMNANEILSFFMAIVIIMFSFAVKFLMLFFISDASSSSIHICFILNLIGSFHIVLAFYIHMLNGAFLVNNNKMFYDA